MNQIKDKVKSNDNMSVARATGIFDEARIRKIEKSVRWGISRYANEADKLAGKIYSKAEALKLFGAPQFSVVKGNMLLNEGINEMTTILCSSGGTKFDASNAYIGVGDSSAAEAATQTGLQAATNKIYKAMSASFPSFGSAQQMAFKASFGSAEANFAWAEFTVANGNSDAAKNLNRKVSAQGTKTAGQTWDCTITITLA